MAARAFRVRTDGWVTGAVVGAVLVFLLAPVVVVVLASFDGGDSVAGRAFLTFPPTSLSLQWYFSIQPRLFHALWVSFLVACFAAGFGTVIGVPAALGLIRGNLPGKTVLSALFRAPLQIPFIVIGVAFLQTWYLLGDAFGIRIAGSFLALAIGHLFVATPYVIGSVGSVLLRFNPNIEEAALSLGASRWRTFRRVTLPIIMPGIYAGRCSRSWSRSATSRSRCSSQSEVRNPSARDLPRHGIRFRRGGPRDLDPDRVRVPGHPVAHTEIGGAGRQCCAPAAAVERSG